MRKCELMHENTNEMNGNWENVRLYIKTLMKGTEREKMGANTGKHYRNAQKLNIYELIPENTT